MKKILTGLFCVIITLGLFASCEWELTPQESPDSRFTGDWIYFYYWEDEWGLEEKTDYIHWTFDETNVARYYRKWLKYSVSYGWQYSGDYIGDYYLFDFEWKIIGNELYCRLWQNPYSDWASRGVFEFLDSSTLVINGKIFEKDEF